MNRTERRTIVATCTTLLACVVLVYLAAGPSSSSSSSPAAAATLPARLSDNEYWQMISDFSEAGGYFRSDNFLSNEAGYQYVIPILKRTVQILPGGVYLGVGPEQNFTYIVAFEPKMAFIVDIRRGNMLEHLLYKALMEVSRDRLEFLSRLFSRPRPAVLTADAAPETVFRAYESVPPNSAQFESNLKLVLNHLSKSHGFKLSREDEAGVRHAYNAFFESGPELTYTFLGGYGVFGGMPTYAELMTETDGRSRNWSFLATEDQFRMVQRLQKNNLIVPLVGDFAGDKAIRSVGRYLKANNAVVSAFYTSNVEQYLFQDGVWRRFYANVAALPIDSSSTFIRYVLNGYGFGRRSRTLWSPIDGVVKGYKAGRIRGYYDIVEMSR
jgi:hypothetical protein